MSDADVLVPLKIDLGISTTARDQYLTQLIQTATQFITDEGITLDQASLSDGMLVEMYAAYLYRARRDGKMPMPRMLRWALNNRLLKEKANG